MTILGADISNYQGDARLAGAGLGLVIAKVSESTGFVDPWFGPNMVKAAAIALSRGGYHFLRGGASGAAQCDFQARLMGGFDKEIVGLDVEVAGAGSQVLSYLREFEKLAPSGKSVGIYSNRGLWAASGGPSDVSMFNVWGWHAGYVNGLYSPYSGSLAAIWGKTAAKVKTTPFGGISSFPLVQFTDKAVVPGIGSAIDGNAWLGTAAELQALMGSTPAPAPTPQEIDMWLKQSPDGTVAAVDWQGKRPLSGSAEIHAYLNLGLAATAISQADMDALALAPAAPSLPAVAAAVLAALPPWVTSATPPPATVDVAALTAALVAALPQAPAGTLTETDVETAIRAVLHNA